MNAVWYVRCYGEWRRMGELLNEFDVAWMQNRFQAVHLPYLIRDADTGQTIEEWFPPEYNPNPRTNQNERQPGSDVGKRRFPGFRRRTSR